MERQELIKKIEQLPPERLAEVEKLVVSIAKGEHEADRKRLHQALADYAAQHAGTAAIADAALDQQGAASAPVPGIIRIAGAPTQRGARHAHGRAAAQNGEG